MRDYAMVYEALKKDLSPHVRSRLPYGFAVRNQLRNFYKKLSPTGTISKDAAEKALIKFKAINESIADNFVWVSELPDDDRFMMYLKRYLTEATDYRWDDTTTNLCVSNAHKWVGVGPGASVGVDSSSFYTKLFDGDLTGTSAYILALYRAAIVDTGSWALAEKARSEKFGYSIVEGNKLFFAPKNAEIARTCCTEPLINMACQKIIGGFLEERLKMYFGISLSSQPEFNRTLCRIGSRNSTFGTIDLQSASDSISWSLIQQLFPANVVGWLSVARSPVATLPSGERVTLKMISTMGNGFTFPLQTMLFAAAVRAVYHMRGLPCVCPKSQFGVFGDDIIVARECYDDVVRYLSKLGFKVNVSKSFNTGPFRESCGSDFFNGVPVRSCYIQSLETTSDVYSAVNRLCKWSAIIGVSLPGTIALLRSWVRMRPIPYQESDDAGIKMPYFLAQNLGVKCRNYTKLTRVSKKKFTAETPQEAVELGYRDYNHDGWLTTYLGGYALTGVRKLPRGSDPDGTYDAECIRGSHGRAYSALRDPIGVPGRYHVARSSVPSWDWHGLHADGVSHDAWESVMVDCLT